MNGRACKRQPVYYAIALVAITITGLGAYAPEERHVDTPFSHEAGRVNMNLPANGSLGEARFGDKLRGIRWPGPDGIEFLGVGGLQARFRVEGEDSSRFIDPFVFEAVQTGFEKRVLSEGCSGGKRYPHRGRDDDGDGAVDEDELDCIDNDGDGLVDEDFAAVGNEMIVTRAVERMSGLVLTQRSYAWAYGHVRDFIGFSTTLQYPARRDERLPAIRELEAALYIDFQIGKADDGSRGANDRFFIIRGKNRDQAEKGSIEFIAAMDSRINDALAAVVVLGATGPGGDMLDGECIVVDASAVGRLLWEHIPELENEDDPALRVDVEKHAADMVAASGGERDYAIEVASVTRALEGDMAFVFLLETIPVLRPGGRLVLEWALVFGRSEAALLRNVQRAIATYRGMIDERGEVHRWVVPARKAARKTLEARLATVWEQSSRRPAAVIVLPEELEIEEIEWLRVGARRNVTYEQIGSKILVTLERELLEQVDAIVIEGQLSDGTVIMSQIGREQIEVYLADEAFPPGSLPEESMQLYPNPFLTTLIINMRVYDLPANSSRSAGAKGNGDSSVKIYDVQGRLVKTIIEQDAMHPGDYSYSWNGMDEYGVEVAPGVYYCKLQLGSRSLTKRVILLR